MHSENINHCSRMSALSKEIQCIFKLVTNLIFILSFHPEYLFHKIISYTQETILEVEKALAVNTFFTEHPWVTASLYIQTGNQGN